MKADLKYFLIGLLVISFIALACRKPSKGKMTIDPNEMVHILADAHLAEAALQPFYGELKDSLSTVYYQQIYDIHQITEEDFVQSMQYLKANPDKLELVYKAVRDRMQKLSN